MKYNIQIPENPSYENRFGFPYQTTLSFVPYIEWLEKMEKDKSTKNVAFIRDVLKTVKKIPELMQPINDLAVVEKYRGEVDMLLSTIIPLSMSDEIMAGIIIPFQPVTVFGTEKLKEAFGDVGQGVWDFRRMNAKKGIDEMIAFAGMAILDKHYHYSIGTADIFKSREMNNMTGTSRFFKPEIHTRFARVKELKKPLPLNEIDLSPLKKEFFNTDFWLDHFPTDTFSFEGFTIYRLVDITDRELISQIEYVLLQTTSMVSKSNITELEEKFRNYFHVSDLKLGIAPMLSYKGTMMGCGPQNWFCLLPVNHMECMNRDFEHSVYSKTIEQGSPMIIDDLRNVEAQTGIEKEMIRMGFRSLMLIPVFKEKELIGMIEMASTQPQAFNFISLLKLKEIIPIITLSFQRVNEEFDNRIQAAMKEYFTAIHPVVEWKFAESAIRVINEPDKEKRKMPEIQFDDVIPVYGQVDIRGSSDKRNEAIRLDLIDYLRSVQGIMKEAYKKYPLPILDELAFRSDKYLEKLSVNLDSSDETSILEFMKSEIEPAFRILLDREPSIKRPIEAYFASLNKENDFYQMRRKDFEQSLTMINDTVSRLLDEEEIRTQKLLPHYFEKYKTDGVEYNLYIGQSIMQEGNFDPVFVKSFRLWQLISMVNIARETKRLISYLSMPLETTQLILCYGNAFSIQFRMDEKRFDVAGAYNIRYEIVKKRIDKAHIKGTNERITQPGKIAVIYSQDREAIEYERYLEYLKARQLITGDIEFLEIEPLQGIQGLKAIRFSVNYQQETKVEWNEEELMKQVREVVSGE